jgi:predicted nucleic acid-binding protein
MIVDTSVWIEFFKTPDSTASHWVAERVSDQVPLLIPEVVLMELLIGTTDEKTASLRRRFLRRFAIAPLAPVRDAEDAAAIHRRCRRRGQTVRSLIDCLVAAMALRLDLAVAHRDRDFDVIATHCGLRTFSLF